MKLSARSGTLANPGAVPAVPASSARCAGWQTFQPPTSKNFFFTSSLFAASVCLFACSFICFQQIPLHKYNHFAPLVFTCFTVASECFQIPCHLVFTATAVLLWLVDYCNPCRSADFELHGPVHGFVWVTKLCPVYCFVMEILHPPSPLCFIVVQPWCSVHCGRKSPHFALQVGCFCGVSVVCVLDTSQEFQFSRESLHVKACRLHRGMHSFSMLH